MANIAAKAISANNIKRAGATVNLGGAGVGATKSYDAPNPTADVPTINNLNNKYSTRFDDVNWYNGGAPSGT